MGVEELEKADQLNELAAFRGLIVALFWAPWSQPCSQMLDAAEELSKEYDNVKFLKIEAEKFPEISLKYEGGCCTDVCFLQGFSRQMVELLQELGAEFATFNILSDQEVRDGLKTFSNWPTFPQLYINGDADWRTGHCQGDEGVWRACQDASKKGSLEARWLLFLIGQSQGSNTPVHPVMIFMKGTPESPCCGFSNSLCQILKEANVEFQSFDILQDEEVSCDHCRVRQGLKKFSNWPTYPQLYANGELIGGLDIVKELKESGELVDTLRAK
eukprot:Em0013g854a